MSFEYWGFTFEGAWAQPINLESRPGVYVIWCRPVDAAAWKVLDVGESEDVKSSVINHEKKEQWKNNCPGTMYYTATYTPSLQSEGRKAIVTQIRSQTS